MNTKRIVKSYVQTYSAPPSEIFPLLCPVREYEWLDGWSCEMIYSESGFAEEGCIFKTKLYGEEETTWIITKRDQEKFELNFVRVTPEAKIINMQISLENNLNGGTNAYFNYIFTALNEKGNYYIDHYAENEFKKSMNRLEKSMIYFLKTGTKLSQSAI